MPIYAYRCANCGHQKDVMQKLSDAPLSICPECGQATFSKQITAPAFQLKGTGWYVTDFRDGSKGGKADAAKSDGAKADTAKTEAAKPEPAKDSGASGSGSGSDAAAGSSGAASAGTTSSGSTPKAA